MTREEEIKKQADIYTDNASNYAEWSDDGGWSETNDIELVEKAFIEGAKWADNWWINKLRNTNISLSGRLHNIWKMMHQRCTNPKRIASQELGGKGRNHIDDVCRGKRKTAFGYKWSYNKTQ